ncbi:MAG: hypothetical protein IR164_07635 [Devosia sp.]|uniref:hypothetical protein n=1 Tax=Devosia sp. TaxID=1871048 RepID=UPI0019E4859B|nr:hypothetical protein [Devosia sp.]MBF0678793.1 hypothetical protein [Devosia sp.]
MQSQHPTDTETGSAEPVALLLQDGIVAADWGSILERAGIGVRAAGGFHPARALLAADPEITHLVTDVGVYIGPSVEELVEYLKTHPRPLKIVVTSEKTAKMDALPNNTVFLLKPVQPSYLIDAIKI